MERKYAEYDAKNGPLFQKLKHKDRLNFEDSSLITHKWTTKMCNGEVEAMPIILEKDELEMWISDDDNSTLAGSSGVEESNSISNLLTSLVKTVDQSVTSFHDSQMSVSDVGDNSDMEDDLSCIFTNKVASLHSFPELVIETMYSDDSYPTPTTQQILSSQSLDSSSDEEMDDYFKFRVFLPRKKVGQIFCNLQTTEAKTELIKPSGKHSVFSIPTSSQAADSENTAISNTDIVLSSECELVLGTMEGDFSDNCSDENLHTSSVRRIARPLSLRYSSEELDGDSGKILCHTTSQMHFAIDEDKLKSQDYDIPSINLYKSQEQIHIAKQASESSHYSRQIRIPTNQQIEEQEKIRGVHTCPSPSCSAESHSSKTKSDSENEAAVEILNIIGSDKTEECEKSEEAGSSSASWWILKPQKLKSDTQMFDEEPQNDYSD